MLTPISSAIKINNEQDAIGLLELKHLLEGVPRIFNELETSLRLYKGEPIVCTSINDTSDACVNSPIFKIIKFIGNFFKMRRK